MPPTLILIRHAEGEHNATDMLLDPVLSKDGLQQCHELEKHLKENCPLASKVELIVTSPMQRAVQTTLVGLQWLIRSGVKVECDAMWQENSDNPCDTGSDLSKVAKAFPELDFSNVDPKYPDKSAGTPYANTRTANLARGNACLERLFARPEKVIAVVTHSGFLRTAICQRRFATADYRIFTFRKGRDGKLELREDDQTEKKGGGMGRSEVGVFGIQEWDFPPEDVMSKIKMALS